MEKLELDKKINIEFKLPKFMNKAIAEGIVKYPSYMKDIFNVILQSLIYKEIDGKGCFEFEISYTLLKEQYFQMVTFMKIASDFVCDIWGNCTYPTALNMDCNLNNHKYTLIIENTLFFLYPPKLIKSDTFNFNEIENNQSYINNINHNNDIINFKKLTCRFFIIDSYNIKK